MSFPRFLIAAGALLMSVPLLGLAATQAPSFGEVAADTRADQLARSPSWDGKRFVNALPTGTVRLQDSWKMVKAYATNDAQVEPTEAPPLAAPSPLEVQGDDRLRITWMGHSSMLIELDGVLVLTDPVWGERASPFTFMGPARFHAPPVALEDLPPLDAVLISHDHYDHLDYPTIQHLAQGETRFFVPLGVGAHLEAWGVAPERIQELDWWEEARVGDVRLVSTPARHFSGRGLTDRNKTLWTSWAVVGPHHRVWFSGDTGPAPLFDEIGERLGPFDATMIEVGAWNALWGDVHLGPEAAVGVHQQVRGDVMIPIHWGTFNLALHAWDAPIVELIGHAAAADVTLAAPLAGGVIDPAAPSIAAYWQDRHARALSTASH